MSVVNCDIIFNMHISISFYTINLEILARILFLWIALKDIFVTFKFRA